MVNYQTMQNYQSGFTTMKIEDVTNSPKDWDDFWNNSTDYLKELEEDGFYFDENLGLSYQIEGWTGQEDSASEYQKKIYLESTIDELESQADDPMGIGK